MDNDLVKREFLIFKRGRGWYRAESQGYTAFAFDAGRYTEQEAKTITHPNGLDGPRDGMFYRHESEVRDYPSDRIEELEAKLAKATKALYAITATHIKYKMDESMSPTVLPPEEQPDIVMEAVAVLEDLGKANLLAVRTGRTELKGGSYGPA